MSSQTKSVDSPTEKRAYSISEFCHRWSMGRNSVFNAIARGELQTIKVGKRRLITVEQEEVFRRQKEAEAAQ